MMKKTKYQITMLNLFWRNVRQRGCSRRYLKGVWVRSKNKDVGRVSGVIFSLWKIFVKSRWMIALSFSMVIPESRSFLNSSIARGTFLLMALMTLFSLFLAFS